MRTAHPDRRLERRQDDVSELARPHGHRRVVAGRLGRRVAGEVLERRDDAVLFEPTDVGRAELRDEIRVLAHRLLDPAPSVVANHVEDRGEALMHADRGHVAPDRGGHPLQVRVEGGGPRQRRRVDGGAVGGEAGEALLMHDGRDAESRGRDELPCRSRTRCTPSFAVTGRVPKIRVK